MKYSTTALCHYLVYVICTTYFSMHFNIEVSNTTYEYLKTLQKGKINLKIIYMYVIPPPPKKIKKMLAIGKKISGVTVVRKNKLLQEELF